MENKYNLIERYLMGDMPVREQAEFEELLRKDEDLMKEFLFRKRINEAIKEDDVIELRGKLNGIIDSNHRRTLKINDRFIISSIAAVMLLLIVITSIYLLPSKKVDTNELFKSYYSPYPAIISVRSSAPSGTDETMYKAFQLYQDNHYDLSFNYFQKLAKDDKSNVIAIFYTAMCEIERNNLDNAANYLYDLTLNNNHVFLEQTHWYLALIYVKQKNTEDAKHILTKIITEDMCMKPEAEKLLESLNK